MIESIIKTGYYYGTPIQIIGTDEEPLFVAADIAKALSHKTGASGIVSKLDDDEKLKKKIERKDQRQTMWLVTEPGLYHLIMQSNKPKAKPFKKWINKTCAAHIMPQEVFRHLQ